MRERWWVPALILGIGIALIADAVVRGSASVALLAIFPVVSGNSTEFLLGVVLLLVGFLTLPFAFFSFHEMSDAPPIGAAPLRGETPTGEVGGLVLIGPVPIFFGSWKSVSSRTKWAVALVGGLLLVGLVLVAFWP
ncbi:MAG: DUF131 domain-containing protein [Thermoplasmata archaeon]|nr:DUF131 domain-containing protein [Thermoplasmata archaeon]